MADYVAKQGTTALGIIGTALGGIATVGPALVDALNNGANRNANAGVADMAAGAALAAALSNRSGDSNDRPVSRYELGLVQENAMLHAQASRLIQERKENGETPPVAMSAVWSWEHENMMDCVARVKVLLSELR